MSTPTEQTSGSFNDLKPDILALIVSKCEPSMYDLCAWSTLSRRMKEVCYSPSTWRSIQIECRPKRNVYGWGLELLAPRAAGLEELTLTKINLPERPNPWMHYSLEKLLEACGPHLRLLHLDYVCQLPFADLLLTIVSRHCPHLKDFEVASTNFFASDAGVSSLLTGCPHLLHLSIHVKENTPLHFLGDVTLSAIATSLPSLKSLQINAHHVTEKGWSSLVGQWGGGEELKLRGYKRGTIASCIANLEKQNNESQTTTLFANLKHLLFAQVLPTTPELVAILKSCPQLRSIDFEFEENDGTGAETAALLRRSVFGSGEGGEVSAFKHVAISVREITADGVEALTASMLTAKLLQRGKIKKRGSLVGASRGLGLESGGGSRLAFVGEGREGGGGVEEEEPIGTWMNAELAAKSNTEHLERERKKEQGMEEWRERQRQKVAIAANGGKN